MPTPGHKPVCPRWLPDLLAVTCLALILLFPTSGFKNGLVWLGFVYVCVQSIRSRCLFHAGGLGLVLLVFLAACLVSSWYSIDSAFSFRQINKLVEFMVGYLVVVNVLAAPGRPGRAMSWLVHAAGAVVVLDVARLAYFAATAKLELVNGRWFDSLLGYPTIAAGGYTIAFLLTVVELVRTTDVRRRWWCVAILAGMVVLIYLLQTRSALLGLGAGVLVFVVLAPLSIRWRAAALGSMAVLLALFAVVPGAFRERIMQGGSSDRVALWKDAGDIMKNGVEKEPYRAWVGFGYGHKMFEKLHGVIPRHRRAAERAYDHTHNLYMELRLQTGYVGVAAFGGLLLMAFVRAVRRFPHPEDREARFAAAGITGAFFALIIYGQFSLFFAFLPALMFWTLMATWMASLRDSATPTHERRVNDG